MMSKDSKCFRQSKVTKKFQKTLSSITAFSLSTFLFCWGGALDFHTARDATTDTG